MTHTLRLLLLCALPWLLFYGWWARGPTPEQRAQQLRAAQVERWQQDRDALQAALRAGNPEFDLMWRLFTILAACDRALEAPEEASVWLALVDDILEDTLTTVDRHGQRHFLLSYADRRPWVQPEAGSLFVDGEIALMIAARRVVEDTPWHAEVGRAWVTRVEQDLTLAGSGWPESYPDEAWAFCLTNALLALRLQDHVDGTDHRELLAHWLERIQRQGMDPGTGLVGSDWRADGRPLDGTEGSSIWWVSTGLLLLDPTLAEAQYRGAQSQLLDGVFGLAWSREWPGQTQASDIDSGPLVPFFDASPAASGFALVAAHAHGDRPSQHRLERALRAADGLLVLDPRLAEMNEAAMGDAILQLGLGFGPLWRCIGPPGPDRRGPSAPLAKRGPPVPQKAARCATKSRRRSPVAAGPGAGPHRPSPGEGAP